MNTGSGSAISAIQRIQGRIEEIQSGLGRRAPEGAGFERAVAHAGGQVASALQDPADGAAPPAGLGPQGALPPGFGAGQARAGLAGLMNRATRAVDVTTPPPGVDPADLGAAPAPAGGSAAYKQLIAGAAERHGLDPALLRAVVAAESGGNPTATSPVGAMGLMQLMPGTAKDLGVSNAYDPAQNVEGGAKYLSRLTGKYGLEHGVAAYNAGPGAVEKYGGVPPYRETRGYVERVMKLYGQFSEDAK